MPLRPTEAFVLSYVTGFTLMLRCGLLTSILEGGDLLFFVMLLVAAIVLSYRRWGL